MRRCAPKSTAYVQMYGPMPKVRLLARAAGPLMWTAGRAAEPTSVLILSFFRWRDQSMTCGAECMIGSTFAC